MFKSARATLNPLQEVILTQNRVLQSLQDLGADVSESSDALRAWAGGEGEDLQDTLSACATLLDYWAVSIISFASGVEDARTCQKDVRTREEGLSEMRRRRTALVSKANSTEKRLRKLSQSDANFQEQTTVLADLRELIYTVDIDIRDEEANLYDWKRIKAREWMGDLFSGLMVCGGAGIFVAGFGRDIIGHVPTERTQPGMHPATYSNHSQVERIVVQAEQRLHTLIEAPEPLGAANPVVRDPPSAERELHNTSSSREVSGGTLQRHNEFRVSDTPGSPASSSAWSTQPHETQQRDELADLPQGGHGVHHSNVADYSTSDSHALCGICFEWFQIAHSPISATLGARTFTALSFGLRLPCSEKHPFCISCLSTYIMGKLDPGGVGDVNAHAVVFPIRCPGCPVSDERGAILDNVAERVLDGDSMSVWHRRKLLDSLPRRYCPNPKCSVLVQIDADADPKAQCPACFQWVCTRCEAMWHKDMDCERYQSLPPDERSREDRLLIRLAKTKKWRRCPGCHALVELTQGCNHITCPCKVEFCFKCGSLWNTERGGCTSNPVCDLWDEEMLLDRNEEERRRDADRAVRPAARRAPPVPGPAREQTALSALLGILTSRRM